jgi:DNA-nicking Smr family endonuclease
MDSRTFTRMKRGKVKPQRKLDLHGMTLAQAHPALIRFIHAAHVDGLRLVIVVTGKGRERAADLDPIPQPRGLLRHHVPGWLHAPPLRQLVLQVTDAHVRHGGSGAYYVYLSRPRK